MLMIKELKNEKGKHYKVKIEATGCYALLEKLGYKSEEMINREETRRVGLEKLKSLSNNAPRIDKSCETCKKKFHPTIYQKKPRYCSRACFFKRNK